MDDRMAKLSLEYDEKREESDGGEFYRRFNSILFQPLFLLRLVSILRVCQKRCG